MATRVVEWKKPYTWWKAIDIDENKVISLRLRDENNLIIRDEWDNEIYVDLQLPDWIRPTDAFPVWITTGRVLVADDWDVTGTLVCFKTTSGDNIKLLYWDDWKLWIDNWTGTFKRIYLKWDVDALITSLRNYVDWQLALKQDILTAWENITIHNNVISAIWSSANGRFLSQWSCVIGEPISFPASTPFEYLAWDYYLVSAVSTSANPTNYRPDGASYTWASSTTVETWDVGVWDIYVYDGTTWLLQINHNAEVSFANIAWQPADNTNLANALNAKQDELVSGTNIKTINNSSILGNWNLTVDGWNTKAFYITTTWSWTTAKAEWQAAYDWFASGKNPIIVYSNVAYELRSSSSSVLSFYGSVSLWDTSSYSYSQQVTFNINLSNWSVSSTWTGTTYASPYVLATNKDYPTPYEPSFNWSPATKKYVDEKATNLKNDYSEQWIYLDASQQDLGIDSDKVDQIYTACIDDHRPLLIYIDGLSSYSQTFSNDSAFFYTNHYYYTPSPNDEITLYLSSMMGWFTNEIYNLTIIIDVANETGYIDEDAVEYTSPNRIQVVASLPANPDANTIYIVQ